MNVKRVPKAIAKGLVVGAVSVRDFVGSGLSKLAYKVSPQKFHETAIAEATKDFNVDMNVPTSREQDSTVEEHLGHLDVVGSHGV